MTDYDYSRYCNTILRQWIVEWGKKKYDAEQQVKAIQAELDSRVMLCRHLYTGFPPECAGQQYDKRLGKVICHNKNPRSCSYSIPMRRGSV